MLANDKERQGLLIAVITGGRPELKQRPTHKFLDELKTAGYTNICWVVSEKDAPNYEHDQHELITYPTKWAEQYAAEHWMLTTPYEPGSFYGAFVGREYACLEAEKRSCWGVMQLDDNITALSILKYGTAAVETVKEQNNMVMFADVLTAITKSTNGRMVGAQLSAIPEPQLKVSRPGFPYSCFIEQVGEGREHWYGPFEDDITHALQYGERAQEGTALVAPTLLYTKESKSKTGMRSRYNHERAVNLHRIFPHLAKITAKSTKANGVAGDHNARVFHHMNAGAIRTPQTITNKTRYKQVQTYLTEQAHIFAQKRRHYAHAKVAKRTRGTTPQQPNK